MTDEKERMEHTRRRVTASGAIYALTTTPTLPRIACDAGADEQSKDGGK